MSMEPTQSSAHTHKRPGTGVGDAAAAASSEIWANKERKPLLSLVPSIQPQKKKKRGGGNKGPRKPACH